MGPRFSGKVREERQRREREVGKENCETGTFSIREENQTPQSTSLPAEPGRGSKNKRGAAVQ